MGITFVYQFLPNCLTIMQQDACPFLEPLLLAFWVDFMYHLQSIRATFTTLINFKLVFEIIFFLKNLEPGAHPTYLFT